MAYLPTALVAAVGRLDLRLDPRITIRKVSRHHWSWSGDGQYLFLGLLAAGCLWVISDFGWVIKLGLVVSRIPFLDFLSPRLREFGGGN
jgi:hypothetical protein